MRQCLLRTFEVVFIALRSYIRSIESQFHPTFKRSSKKEIFQQLFLNIQFECGLQIALRGIISLRMEVQYIGKVTALGSCVISL